MQNIVTLVKDEDRENKSILKNLDPKKKYKLQIELDNGRVIYYIQKLSPERIYEELEVLEFVGIIPSGSFSRKEDKREIDGQIIEEEVEC